MNWILLPMNVVNACRPSLHGYALLGDNYGGSRSKVWPFRLATIIRPPAIALPVTGITFSLIAPTHRMIKLTGSVRVSQKGFMLCPQARIYAKFPSVRYYHAIYNYYTY